MNSHPDTTSAPRAAFGARVVRHDAAPSTNDVAKALARAGEPHGTVVVALEQTRGKGQRGRSWAAPRGGLWMSLLARPADLTATRGGLLNVAMTLAAAEAGRAVSGVAIAAKWPNDLLVHNRKVGGILVEAAVSGQRIEWAVIGIGINVNLAVEDLPAELRDTTASLRQEAGRDLPMDDMMSEVCARADDLLRLLESDRDAEIMARWRAIDSTPGRRVRWTDARRPAAVAVEVDHRGRLMARVGTDVVTIETSAGIILE